MKETLYLVLSLLFGLLFVMSAMAADSEYILFSVLGVLSGLAGAYYCSNKFGKLTR